MGLERNEKRYREDGKRVEESQVILGGRTSLPFGSAVQSTLQPPQSMVDRGCPALAKRWRCGPYASAVVRSAATNAARRCPSHPVVHAFGRTGLSAGEHVTQYHHA